MQLQKKKQFLGVVNWFLTNKHICRLLIFQTDIIEKLITMKEYQMKHN